MSHSLTGVKNALIIGAGYLGARLAVRLSETHRVTLISRTNERHDFFEKRGMSHHALDIRKRDFSFQVDNQDLVIFNPAVTVDKKQTNAKQRLYVLGFSNVLRLLSQQAFRGQLIVVGSTSAVTRSQNGIFDGEIDEETFSQLGADNRTPSYQQFALWKDSLPHFSFRSLFLVSAGIYGPYRHPGTRIRKGLRAVQKRSDRLVNLIHVEDLTEAILFLQQQNLHAASNHDLFFLSDGNPLSLQEYYGICSQRLGEPHVAFHGEPTGAPNSASPHRRISNRKLLQTGFRFKYPEFKTTFEAVLKEERA